MPKGDWPLCSWEAGCRSVARRDPETDKGPSPDLLCAAHARIAAEIAALPEQGEEVHTEELAIDEPPIPVAIESLRDALRGAVQTTEVAALMESMLLDALRASKMVWHSCPHCKRRSTVQLADLATRVGAITKLLEVLEGRLKDGVESEWDAERRAIEKRQQDLQRLHGIELDAEIERLSEQLGADSNSRHDQRYDKHSTEDLLRFVQRLEGETK
jgi:hypothetical protein